MFTRVPFLKKASRAVAFLSVPLLIFVAAIVCSDTSTNPDDEYAPRLTGCKDFQSGTALSLQASPDQDCVEYEFNDGVLHITHLNAGFNCCTGAELDIDFSADVITITEADGDGGACHCLCLFDYEYFILNLEESEYTIKIIEPYLPDGDAEMEFTVDFAAEKSGSFCLDRTNYPWGQNVWSGNLKSFSECGGFENFDGDNGNDTASCAIWTYNESGTLKIIHTNAVFNCCVQELLAEYNIDVAGGLITIAEDEVLENGGCDCICPYDFEHDIYNLPPGEYTIKFLEPYLNPQEDSLIFTIDLVNEQSGEFCVERLIPEAL
ncbi:MAG: hypothetical protein GWN00_09070 [Aliifodinibius sp.]|jgi:hypothetical protein|nr:hypothetical protein [candidate division Zixibacteria bacterium]NIT56364.1 hypothetical protein [Fodinibius sp.]NIX55566.1 hypothetical protein [candidate division Zixibacteria bacterium]NIY24947.1 hypothetical protein [Fodinibius sp.]